MNRFIYYLSSLVFLLCWSTGCDSEGGHDFPCGTLHLQVERNTTMLTKAQQPVTDQLLRVEILTAEGDTVKSYDDYLTQVKGKDILLPVGTYTVSVRSVQTLAAGWEKPFYAGSAEVEIKSGELTATQLICKIANTKVAVVYADDLAHYFTDYTTVVGNSSGSLTYTRDEYRAGYFAPEKLTADLSLVNKDGNRFTLQRVFPDVKERTFYKLRFYLSDPGDDDQAGADFNGVTVEEKADTVYYTIFIRQESLAGKGKPVLTLEGDFSEQTITYKKESPTVPSGSIRLEVPNGIQRLEVKAESRQFETLGVPVFDLCKLTDPQRAALASLYFPTPEGVEGQTSLTLPLSEAFTKALDTETVSTVGTHTFTVSVLDQLNQESTLQLVYKIRPNVQVTTEQPLAWAKFILLKGNAGDKDGIGFMLKKANESTFTRYEATHYDETTGDFSVLISEGIDPATDYVCYAVAGIDDKGDEIAFTTEGMPVIPNLNFDDWYKDGKIWYPDKDLGTANYYWDSGNGGASAASKTPTEPTDDAISGKAVYMHSEMATIAGIGAFAAGNIYTGQFIEAIIDLTNPGAKLDFGRPYTGRPTKLRGHYKYTPGTIDQAKAPYTGLKGKPDTCSIYIALCDWSEPFHANTQTGTFVNLNDRSILAFGQLDAASAAKTMTDYEAFEIDIVYRNVTKKPTYILIVASASKYGDYFTGSTSSKLYIDEFELGFDYNPASFAGTELSR